MAKKTTPIITHTEIICLAIRCLEQEVEEMRKRCDETPGMEVMLQAYTSDKEPKLEALRMLYRIETGADFV